MNDNREQLLTQQIIDAVGSLLRAVAGTSSNAFGRALINAFSPSRASTRPVGLRR